MTIQHDLPATPASNEPDTPSRRRRPLRLVVAGLCVLAVLGSAAYWLATQDEEAAATEETAATAATATAEVTRTSLAATRTFDGTLGHGEPATVASVTQGTLTRIAEQGTDVVGGTELFRVDEQPVTAMLGDVPMYRDLGVGATGADVAQLERNLEALGYEGFTVDDEFTAATADAVREWQADLGVPETGQVERADIMFVPQAGRVDTIHSHVGTVLTPGTLVLDLTGAEQAVTLDVEVRDRDLLPVDAEVTVELPGGDAVPGVVTAASVVPVGNGGEGGGSSESITRVEVTLSDGVDQSLLGAPADVVVQVDERESVLTVPVNALVALTGGGHGVEVVADDGTSSLVPVETGLFADGRVEIDGEGLEEGTTVGVAGR